MRTIYYFILGLLLIFTLIIIIAAQPSVPTIAGIILGGLILAAIPFIVLFIRQIPKRDRKHEDSDIL